MRVLIYNDDTTESAALARLVSYAGHDPVVVPEGARARAAVVAGVVDVAVLDLERHEDDTIELVRLSSADGRQISTLLVATEPTARLIIECHRLGASDFILRRLSRGEFRGVFDRICDRHVGRAHLESRARATAADPRASGLGAQLTVPGHAPASAEVSRPAARTLAAPDATPAVPDQWSAEAEIASGVLAPHPTGLRSASGASKSPTAPPTAPSRPPEAVGPVTPGAPAAPAARTGGGWYDDREGWPEDAAGANDQSWGSNPPTQPPASPPPRALPPRAPAPLPPLPTLSGVGGVPFEDLNADPVRSEARIRHFIQSSEGSLPVPARVVARLARLESEESPDFDQVVEVVESNAMMVRGIMRQAASAEQYRGQPPLKTVRECVTRLGTRRVISAAMAASMRVNFEVRDPDFMRVFGAVWVAQYVASRVAERLCQHLRIVSGDAVQNRVLFMDVGEMVICRAAVEYWPQEIRGGAMSANLLRFMHDNVRSIGAFTLRHWGMPEDFAAMARRDSRLSGETSRPNVTRLHIALASAHAARQCLGPAAGIPAADPVSSELWNRLGINEANVRKMAEEMLVSTKRLLQG